MEFILRTEELSDENIENYYVEMEEDNELLKKLRLQKNH